MLKKLAIYYLQQYLRKNNIDNLEIVIRSDSHTMYKRNIAKEESIKETISLIKQFKNK